MGDDLDLDALKALTDAATPGPWTATANRSVDDANGEYVIASVAARKLWPTPADAAFIAATRTAVPALIEQLADARHELDVLRRINRELSDGNLALNQLVIDVQRERDAARQSLARLITQPCQHPQVIASQTAELERLQTEWDREYRRAEGWADQYNRVARQVADLRDERDTAVTEAKQARADARQSEADAWAEVHLRDTALATVRAERDRRGEELRRAQAVVDAAKAWRAMDARSTPDVAKKVCDLADAIDALEAPVPP